MSEEEIIYILKQRIERKTVSSDPYYITQKAIEGILDLYQKEKEKRDILQTNYEILQGEMNRIGIDTLRLEAGNSTDDVIEEIKKKDKMIDLMAKAIENLDNQLVINHYRNKEEVIERFRELLEERN